MTDEKKNNRHSQYKATSSPDPAQILEQAEQKAKDIPLPDLDTMSREEIQQRFHELHVKQIEAGLQNEQLRNQLEEKNDHAALFRIVTEDMLDMVTLTDMEGNFTFTGKAHEILGYEPGFLIGKNVMDFVHPEDLPRILKEMSEFVASVQPRKVDYRYRCDDGSYLWLETVGNFIKDENGVPQKIIFNSRDITERKRTEHKLRESEEKYRFMTEQMHDVVWTSDLEMRVTYISPSDERILGFTPKEREKHTLVDMLTPSSQEKAMEAISKEYALEESGQADFSRSVTVELEYRHKDGSTRWLETLAKGIRDDKGLLIGFHGVSRDITERKQSEEALRKSERQLRSTVDGLLAHIVVLNEYGEIILTNKAYRDFGERNGIEPSTVSEGTNYLAVCDTASGEHSEEAKPFAEGIREVLSGKRQSFELEYPCHSPDEKRWFIGRVTSFTGEGPRRVIVAHENITQRKRAEENLRESEERFHELFERAPLGYQSLDSDGRFIEVNFAWLETLGYKREEVIGKWFDDFLAPEYIQAFKERFPVFKAQGEVHSEFYLMHKDGSRRYIAFDGRIGHNTDGSFKQTHCILKDETERRRVEEALRENEALLSRSQEIAHIGSWKLDLTANRLTWSDEVYRIFGCEPQEFAATYEAFLDFVHPDDRVAVDEAYSRSVREGNDSYEIEHRIVRRNSDEVRHVHERCVHERDDAGAIIQSTGMVQDITERKQAEKSLRESEQRFKTIIQNLPGAVFAHDLEGRLLFVNKTASANTGYSEQELLAMTLPDIDSGDFTKDERHQLWHSLNMLESKTIQSTHTRKNGSKYPVEIHLNAISLDNQPVILPIVIDITKRKKTESALRKSEERYRALANNIPDIIYSLDGEGNIVTVNKNAFERYGYNEQDFKGKPFLDFVHPVDRDTLISSFLKAIEEKRKITTGLQFRIVAKNGSSFWFELNASARFDSHGRYLGEEGTLRDITERQQIEAERERLRTAIEQGDDVVIITDADGLIQYVNPAFETVTGYTRKEVLGQNPRIFKSGKQDEAFYREMWDTLTSGNTFHGRMINKRKDGSVYTEDATISPVRDAAGNIVNYVAVKRDVTAHIQLETQLLQAQKMESVGRLAGGVAHDYNNMLSVILGYTEMAMEQVDQNDSLYADLKEVYTAGKRSMEITGQLLAFARKQIISPVVMDLNETVDGMLKMLRRLIGEDIDFAWEPAVRLWPVNMDPSQIDQILANLCVNARDAISGVGKITIETENVSLDESYCAEHAGFIPGDFVMLAVSDNGCGMDKETMAQIFEPFFTTKEIGKGTGLGLATIYGIVKQNNGFVNVYSEPGKGTTFRIYLPRHPIETDEAIAEVTPEEVAFGQGETLLLVEDEPAIIKMCRTMLEKLGYNVLIAHAPDEAVKLASEHSGIIHLLMSDVVMPEMNGRDLADKLQAMRPDIRVLFMSGYTANAIAHHGVLDEGEHFIQKPFSMKKLSVKVREALKGGKSTQQ